ncbi:MAG: hypothetical protein HPY78_03465 [Brevinematales bacterium]|nr:hypothetical protein [Brevinematales bacterium]
MEKKDSLSIEKAPGEKVIFCEVYSRVVGYYSPINNWNKGKKQEFRERRYYKVGQDGK